MCSCDCDCFVEESWQGTRDDGKAIYKCTKKCKKCHCVISTYYEYR
jgi:hypothetical protein